jgi:hypothetical protein
MANLTSLDTNVLGQIACYLPEADQMALRKVSGACNRILETEELWKKKCELMYPTSAKAAGVTWRDHFISCYIQNFCDIGHRRGVAFGGRYAQEITFSALGVSSIFSTVTLNVLLSKLTYKNFSEWMCDTFFQKMHVQMHDQLITRRAGQDHLTIEQLDELISVTRAAEQELQDCSNVLDRFENTIFFTYTFLLGLFIGLSIASYRNPDGTRRICEKICGAVMSNWVFFRTMKLTFIFFL